MENKNLMNNIITFAAFVFAGIFIYLAINLDALKNQENPPENKKENVNQTVSENKKNKSWEELIPEIRIAIKNGLSDAIIETVSPLDIYEEVELTGDDINEALIDLGSGGAYTEEFVLMMIQDGKPVLAKFRQKDGKVSSLIFLNGSSARNGETVEILSENKAVISGYYSIDDSGEKIENCEVEAYEWNNGINNIEVGIFEYSRVLSEETEKDYCADLQKINKND